MFVIARNTRFFACRFEIEQRFLKLAQAYHLADKSEEQNYDNLRVCQRWENCNAVRQTNEGSYEGACRTYVEMHNLWEFSQVYVPIA